MLNVGQIAVAKLLDVYLRHDLNFSQHVESIIATYSQRLYLLAQNLAYLNDSVFKAIRSNKIVYALPVFFRNMVKHRPPRAMRLRKRGHDYELPTAKFDFNK